MATASMNVHADELPASLAADLDVRWQSLLERCNDQQRQWYEAFLHSPRRAQLLRAFACSPALVDYCVRQPDTLPALADQLQQSLPADYWPAALQQYCGDNGDPEEMDRLLREFRHRHWLRIVWRDLNRLAPLEETVSDLSRLADVCIGQAVDFYHRQLSQDWGEPRSIDGQPQRLVVIAMGKLGAGELNLSSDIDLIFSYPRSGQTQGGKRSCDNQEFFARLGQRLIKALDTRTPAGFAFRVDMRLRPYGQSGPLVMSFDALEEYYQDQGRDWERYAWIKARAVTGDAAGDELMAKLRPFVYRRYLDFSAFESLRDMKSMIQREVQRRNLQDNIKLGSGGIREVEFIAQCFQLIRGGQETELQARGLQDILQHLLEAEYLPAQAVKDLQAAYRFLRNTEHAIQAWRDQQTQQLPAASDARVALCTAMGFGEDWSAFSQQLEQHRLRVAEHFSRLIALPEEEGGADQQTVAHWQSMLDDPDQATVQAALEDAGFDEAGEAARVLVALLTGAAVQRMQRTGRERLDDFLPLLLDALGEAQAPSTTLLRIMPLIEAVLRRTAYLVLLMENPGALARLVQLCDASPWISRQLAANPVLLDELLDPRSLFYLPEKDGLRSELRQRLLRIDEDDLEAQMEALRYYKLAHLLRVAASEISGSLPLMKVSDYLTYIAEVVLEAVLDIAWQNLIAKHGHLPGDDGQRFVILGYGKLGGIELGYGSDLDLVFLHDAAGNSVSDGERPLDSNSYFTRLGQRIIHILSAHTRMGAAYEVDMRLRPSGNSGLLVSSFKSFEEYQRKQAWTWEHQALVRARVVAGHAQLGEDFYQLRRDLLCQRRDQASLLAEVVSMREKMRKHLLPALASEKNAEFDLKQSPGGIVDIEFMVQYGVLTWAHQHPPLAQYTDNIRILESLQSEGLILDADAQALIDAYKAFRSQAHRLSLQEQKGGIAATALPEQRAAVVRLWQTLMVPEN